MSQRGAAKFLGVARGTIERRFKFLGDLAVEEHRKWREGLAEGSVNEATFDELETAEHTKMKPLSVAIAVTKDRRILSFQVSQMSPKGELNAKAIDRYGHRRDERSEGLDRLMQELVRVVSEHAILKSDQSPLYRPAVRKWLPKVKHLQFPSRNARDYGQGEIKIGAYDPLFELNHTAATLRASLSRLIRQSWCLTKCRKNLFRHLAIFACYHHRRLQAETRSR
jgi:hypothetical protein